MADKPTKKAERITWRLYARRDNRLYRSFFTEQSAREHWQENPDEYSILAKCVEVRTLNVVEEA